MERKLAKLIIREIRKRKISKEKNLAPLKRGVAKRFKKKIFSNFEILQAYRKLLKKKEIKKIKFLENLLRIRRIRSLSGIAVVSVLTKPYPCPGNCLYCPTQKGIPKSYLDNEPAVMRAVLNNTRKVLKGGKITRARIEYSPGVKWGILDCGELVIHVFEKNTRNYYSLERLWADAKITALHAEDFISEPEKDIEEDEFI